MQLTEDFDTTPGFMEKLEMKKIFLFSLLSLLLMKIELRANGLQENPLAHTFSIVAVDEKTGQIGVAVQSHWFSVGSIVSWAEAGAGAVATQSFVNPSFGPRGLALLKSGLSPQQALDTLVKEDKGRDFRQLAIINAKGQVAAYTGAKCISFASHIKGRNYSVQANMMLNEKVVPAMAAAFENSSGPLAERMLSALKAAQKAGGDIRGQQSAALTVVKGRSGQKPWKDRLIDLRVEDHPSAMSEIERLLKVYRAYEHMNNGDLAVEKGENNKALKEYNAAMQLFPKNTEMKYWTAVSLINMGEAKQAFPLFKEVFEKNRNWLQLTPRIVANGLLKVDKQTLQKILELVK